MMLYIWAAQLLGGRRGAPAKLVWVLATSCLCVAMTGCALWDGMEGSTDSEAKVTADAMDLDTTGDDVSAADADAQSDIGEDTRDTAADDVVEDVIDADDASEDADDADDASE